MRFPLVFLLLLLLSIISAKAESERFQFQTEVPRLMNILVNSLYNSKEIFLRELISNASDALDKIRFISLTDKSAIEANPDLHIKIRADPENRVLVISDTGLGMTKENLKQNLGTIAKSGTKEFVQQLEKGNKNDDSHGLIGQFGVGFYSTFLVADKVVVTSKHNDDNQYIWESKNVSDFSISEDARGNTLGRGTEITLHIKEDAQEFLDESRLRGLISKYSEFINFPIQLWTTKTEEVPVEEEEQVQEKAEVKEASDEEEPQVEDVNNEPKSSEPKTKTITTEDWELINTQKPIWTRSPKEVTDLEYDEFFKAVYKESENPIAHSHFFAEGPNGNFKAILYIPSKAPNNFYGMVKDTIKNVRLFVQRVFITDELADFMPKYLAFIKALVDADDLPLNVSRETLQQDGRLGAIKSYLIRKSLDMLADLSKDTGAYRRFFKEFGTSMKLGVIDDKVNRKKFAKLLRFPSSNDDEKMTSLEDYVDRMKKGQQQIFYLTGTSVAEIKKSPFVERLLARGFEVLYMAEAIDEYMLQHFHEFGKHKFQSAAKSGLKFGDEDESLKEQEAKLAEQFKPLAEWLKTVFADQIEKVEISNRLTSSPCAIVANEYGWSGNMERIMRSQAVANNDDFMLNFYAGQKKILEINPKHPIIGGLLRKVEGGETEGQTVDIAKVLYETTMIRSGFVLKEHKVFAERVQRMMRQLVGVDLDIEAEQDEAYLKAAEENVKPTAEDEAVEEVEQDEVVVPPAEESIHDEL